MRARAKPPSREQDMQLFVLRLMMATYACDIKPGATASVLQMVVASNERFKVMPIFGFPKCAIVVEQPNHVGLGIMEVTGDGLTSVGQEEVVVKTRLCCETPRSEALVYF